MTPQPQTPSSVSADAAHDGAAFDLPPEHVTPWQLYILLQQLNTKQSIIIHEAGRMTRRMDAMEQDTSDLVAAWKTGGAVLRVVKWSAIVGAAALTSNSRPPRTRTASPGHKRRRSAWPGSRPTTPREPDTGD